MKHQINQKKNLAPVRDSMSCLPFISFSHFLSAPSLLAPVPTRPKTSAVMAHRTIINVLELGGRGKTAKSMRDEQALAELRRKENEKKTQQKSVWSDDED